MSPSAAPYVSPRPIAPASPARELTFNEAALLGEAPLAPLLRLAARLREERATLIGLMIFGSFDARRAIEDALARSLGEPTWPVLWIDGASCHGTALAGVQAFALTHGAVDPVVLDGRVVASRYSLGDATLCWVGEMFPNDPTASPAEQTTQAFANLVRSLHAAGFALGDVVRTWCYNEHLLAWYDAFNRVRSGLYRGTRFRTGSAPASTGISAANSAGAALTLAALAVRPARPGDATVHAREVASPLQCPAPAYGSAFSRAMELRLGNERRLLISGTASIEPGGATVWHYDIDRQTDLTLQVIGAILESREMGWSHVTRAIAYFKSPRYAASFESRCRRLGLPPFPRVQLHCDICRDDLLFELELDASLTL